MDDAHNFDAASPHAIGNQIACVGYEQFARARDTARTANGGVCRQKCHRLCDTPPNKPRSRWVIARNITKFLVEVLEGSF
jgi:hypothetical protein